MSVVWCRYVCCTLTDASSVSQKLMGSSELKMLFNEDELSMLKSHLVEESVDITTTPLKNGR